MSAFACLLEVQAAFVGFLRLDCISLLNAFGIDDVFPSLTRPSFVECFSCA